MPDPEIDVLVVGAGPAGMAAAAAACESGRRITVVDDNPAPGGQIWRGEKTVWVERFRRSGARLLPQTAVIDCPAPGLVHADSDGTPIELRYRKLIVATGARERFLPFPGWTLPNVMGAGGLQALVKCGLAIRDKRVVVAGTGPLLLAVAAYLRKRGAQIRLIAEQAHWRRLTGFTLALGSARLAQAVRLRAHLLGIRYLTGCWPVSAEGREKLEAVVLRRGAKTWQEPCDYLACSFGLVANLELPALLGCRIRDGAVEVDQWQETSVPGVYCAGEPAGIGGVEKALVEGAIAGYAAAGRTDRARERFAARRRAVRFQEALDRAFCLRPELRGLPRSDTIVCRCEDVPLARLREYGSWRAAKLHTRCGMGPCQGRICGPALRFLLGWTPDSVRPPIFPAALRTLASG